jgi:hypothetical protein
MAAGNWILYNDFIASAFKKKMDLTADTIKVALVTSASVAINKALVTAQYATIDHELTTSGGYTAGGVTPGSPTVTGGGATATITEDIANATWTGSGGGFTARAAVAYDDSATNKDLIAYCLLDSTPADVVIAAGVTLTITIANIFSAA